MTLSELLATPEYSGLSDEQAYELLHQKRHVGTHRVTYRDISRELGVTLCRRLIETVDNAAETDSLVAEMREYLRGNGDPPGLDVGHAETRAMIDAFAADTNLPLTEDDAEAIKTLAIVVSDADLYGFQAVEVKHIHWDRSGIRQWR